MTPYAEDESAHRRVRDSAAVVSGRKPPKIAADKVEVDNTLLIKAWAEETVSIVDFWKRYLFGDRDKPIEQIEASGLKITVQSLLRGLTKYLFEEDARLRAVDQDAWDGIQGRWIEIHKKILNLFNEIVNYGDWIFEVNKKDSQITDPIAIRNMIRQKRMDTQNIVILYAEVVADIESLIEEVLDFL